MSLAGKNKHSCIASAAVPLRWIALILLVLSVFFLVPADCRATPPTASIISAWGYEDTAIVVTLGGTSSNGLPLYFVVDSYGEAENASPKGTLSQYSAACASDSTSASCSAITTFPATVTDPEGRIIYIPPANTNSAGVPSTLKVTPSLSYRAVEIGYPESDPEHASQQAQVAIWVESVNDPPLLIADSPSSCSWSSPTSTCYCNCNKLENQDYSTQISGGGRDIDSNSLSIEVTSVDCVFAPSLIDIGGNPVVPGTVLSGFVPGQLGNAFYFIPAEDTAAAPYCTIRYKVYDGNSYSEETWPITINVRRDPSTFTVTPSATEHGTISPDTAQTVSEGETVSFTITPDSGYGIYSLGGTCGGGTLAGDTYTTNPITADCTVSVTFRQCSDAITVGNANDSGDGSLRQAISDVCADGTITFDADYTIPLASQLTIDRSVTIDGAGHTVTLSGDSGGDGAGDVRVFYVNGGATLNLSHLTVTKGNAGADYGGGIYNNGALNVTSSTFSDNSAAFGGGIINYGALTITDGTFAGNTATYNGGGIYNVGTLNLTNSTFSGNSGISGGGIYISTGAVTVKNSIIGNSTGSNCSGTIGGSNNLADDASCGAGFTNSSSILLGTLGDYGGSTRTIPLLPGSSAIDAGDDATCAADPVNNLDQRGVERPQGTNCDIGAFESRGFTFGNVTGTPQSALLNTAFTNPLALDVTSTYGEPVNGGKVTFTPPGAGASATLIGSPATISDGAASVTASANGAVGSYNVIVSAAGVVTPVQFALTNTQPPSHTVTPFAGANGSMIPAEPQTVEEGSETSFACTADAGYHIASVSGCWGTEYTNTANGVSSHTYTTGEITADCTVTATFAVNSYSLTYSADPNGTISGSSPQTVNYGGSGTAVTAVPSTGYRFVKWSDDSTDNPRTDTNVTADISVTASFQANTPPVASADTYDVDLGQSLTVTSPGVLGNDTDANGDALSAALVSGPAHATAFSLNADGSFTYKHDGTKSGNDGFTYKAKDSWGTESAAATVTLVLHTHYSITATAGENGSISPSGAVVVNAGSSITYTFTPEAGFRVKNVTVDGISQGSIRTYTFDNINDNHEIHVQFARVSLDFLPLLLSTCTVKATVSRGHGSVDPRNQSIEDGKDATIDLIPETGYHVASITDNGKSKPIADPYVITKVTADHNVVVTFAK